MMKNNFSKLETIKQFSKPQVEQKKKYLKVIEKSLRTATHSFAKLKITELLASKN